MPKERGGQGLPLVGMAACYEEMNRSIFGPVCFNSAAPDDGNMMVLNKIGTPAQKERWLQPIIDGKVRSAFAMTEPHPGGGSDPSMMQTVAERKGDRWVINGRKWYITGAGEAQHFILIARTSDDARKGLTAFLFDKDQPGWEIVRRIPIMGPEEHGGHCELVFDGLEIPDENVLMNIGDGLKVTQIRLGPARLTHCMRWTGLAKRSLEIAGEYVKERGQLRQQAGRARRRAMAAGRGGDADRDRPAAGDAARRASWTAASFARKEVSMAKVQVADTLFKAVDTAIQLCGARGYSKDTVLEWIYRYARQARLVDGASEVHKMVLSRSYLERGRPLLELVMTAGGSGTRRGFSMRTRLPRLEAWLADKAGADRVTVVDEGPLSGGAISLNLAVTLEIEGGRLAGRHEAVLRTGSASGVSASLGKAQEGAVLRAAFNAGALAPEPLFISASDGQDDALLGAPFYIMRRARGVAAGRKVVKSDQPQRELAREMGRQLGLIHSIRPGAAGAGLPADAGAITGFAVRARLSGVDRAFAGDAILCWRMGCGG